MQRVQYSKPPHTELLQNEAIDSPDWCPRCGHCSYRSYLCLFHGSVLDDVVCSTAVVVEVLRDGNKRTLGTLYETLRWSNNAPSTRVLQLLGVYYRQRTIQNTKQSIKQQEQKKATSKQKCTQSIASDGNTSGIRFCHLCVHITKACVHAGDCTLCRAKKKKHLLHNCLVVSQKLNVSSENKGSN